MVIRPMGFTMPDGDDSREDDDEQPILPGDDDDDDPPPRRRRAHVYSAEQKFREPEEPATFLIMPAIELRRIGEMVHARTAAIPMEGDGALMFAAFEMLFELDEHVDMFEMEV